MRAWRGSDDYREANQVALKVSEGDAVAAAHLMKWAERMADVIIESHWDQFPSAVEALVEHGKLTVGMRHF